MTYGGTSLAVPCVRLAGDVDCVFIGCSALRVCTPGYLSALERACGAPVVAKPAGLRIAGVADRIEGYGALSEH